MPDSLIQLVLHDPLLVRGIGVSLGVVFILAALSKINDIELFKYTIELYGLVPEFLLHPLAVLIPVWELVAGFFMAFYPEYRIGTAISLGLIVIITGAVAVKLFEGGKRIECGCGFGGQEISWYLVLRNVFMAVLILIASLEMDTRYLGLFDYFSLVFTVLALLLIYVCVNQLIANSAKLKELRA